MLKIPKVIETLINQVSELDYDIYIVGGAVRDSLMNKEVLDWDLATNCPMAYITHLYPLHQKDFAGKDFGNVKILIDEHWVSITQFRKDTYLGSHRYPSQVEFVDSFQEDILRRDFTINGLGYHPQQGLIDYCGGLDDLNHRVLRTIIDPETSFNQDVLRVLRCIRFASILDFEIEETTLKAIDGFKELVKDLSPRLIDYEVDRMDLERLEKSYPQLYYWIKGELIS